MKIKDLKSGYVYRINDRLYIFYSFINTTNYLDGFNDIKLIFFNLNPKKNKFFKEDMYEIECRFYEDLKDLPYKIEETNFTPYKIKKVIQEFYEVNEMKPKTITIYE